MRSRIGRCPLPLPCLPFQIIPDSLPACPPVCMPACLHSYMGTTHRCVLSCTSHIDGCNAPSKFVWRAGREGLHIPLPEQSTAATHGGVQNLGQKRNYGPPILYTSPIIGHQLWVTNYGPPRTFWRLAVLIVRLTCFSPLGWGRDQHEDMTTW